ncbi:Protein disulfide-isomerase A4 [Theileria parva strain Muguga]|uniref:Protein disulfide-isomerase A4 n=1 Tax=Theileria parva strain Muguga TaxID=333668 RepID=UPI001C62285F|nr:Protein disulfide-isomerase A4 [Theileria parva strain Muguga]EAN33373.2 Protein disulfide-isomerase A4 [Theileria parva strain Muguga]
MTKLSRKLIIFLIVIKLYTKSALAGLVLEVPEVAQSDFEDYVKKAKRIPVVLNYPTLFIFSTGAINDFRNVSTLLSHDQKCEFITVESSTAFDGNITSLEPVLTYVKDGETKKYDGPINPGYIMSWLSNQNVCEMRVKDLSNFKSFQKSLPSGHVQVLVLFAEHDPKLVETVRSFIAEKDLAVPVLFSPEQTLSDQIVKSLSQEGIKYPTLLIMRNMSLLPKITFYTNDVRNKKELYEFLKEELIPPIHSTNSYMLPMFLVMKKTIVYIYTRDKELKKYLSESWINTVPRKHSEKLVFLHSKGSDLVENKMNTILAIDSDYEEIVVRAFVINLDTLEFYKFKPLTIEDGTISEQGMNRFIDDLENDRLSHYVKSELPIPENIDRGPVKTIVGEDFHRRVIESKDDILVLFLSSWCGHCHKAKRVFRDMGRRLKGSNGPILATFDAYNNEVEDMEISQFPTIALFQSGNKSDPVFYNGPDNLEDISLFLEKNCKRNKVNAENILQKHVSQEQIFEFHTEL